jgi:hypothetical protein
VALIALPILWLILRAVPPAPIRRRFPGVALLLGLEDRESQADRTPWWLMLLRILAVAAVILGFAGPILNPREEGRGSGPLLLVMDGTWADARDWAARLDRAEALLGEAAREGRTAALVSLTTPPTGAPEFRDAEAAVRHLPNLAPQPWLPSPGDDAAWAEALASVEGGFDTVWLSDGLAREGQEALVRIMEDKGAVTVIQAPRQIVAVKPARFDEGASCCPPPGPPPAPQRRCPVAAIGPRPRGDGAAAAHRDARLRAGGGRGRGARSSCRGAANRVTRFELPGLRSAARRDADGRRAAAARGGAGRGRGRSASSSSSRPLHYLREALAPNADLVEGTLADVIRQPDVIALADVATLAEGEAEDLRPGSRGAGCSCALPGRGSPRRTSRGARRTRSCRCGCARAGGAWAAR